MHLIEKNCRKTITLFSVLMFLLIGCSKKTNSGNNPVINNPVTECRAPGWASMNGGTVGGGNAKPTIVKTYAELKAAVENAAVKVVQIEGAIAIPSGGKIVLQNQSSKTIFGTSGATLSTVDQTGPLSGIFYLKQSSNIILQNIVFDGAGAYDVDGNDNLTIENCTNVWVDHCDFLNGLDGNFDIKTASDFITVSYCKFSYTKPPRPGGPGGSNDHRLSNLVGSGDASLGDRNKLSITFVRCWWAQGCVGRMPRVRFGKVHVLNNYFSSTVSSSCVQAGFEANLLIEGNIFEGVRNPIDLMANNSTAVLQRNNLFLTITGNTNGTATTAFTPPYSIAATAATDVKSIVTKSAGATLSGKACTDF